MPSQPDGERPPDDGALPSASLRAWGERPFSCYVHVPFCTTRCGYCDFNTYTAAELAGSAGADRAGFPEHLAAEVSLARRVLGSRVVPVSTVFVGGGTPTLLPPTALGQVLRRVGAEFGLAPGAEVSVEANPDTVDERRLAGLLDAGFTRISFGMQSAVPQVLAVLERTHTPGGALRAVELARRAGFERISLDLIYGTPGESLADWDVTVEAALGTEVEHVSAYALIVEPGTRLAAQVRRGGSWRPRTTTSWRTCTSWQTIGSPPPDWPGTSCPTGRPRGTSAGTTSATGTATTGGVSGRARTATSPARGGGT